MRNLKENHLGIKKLHLNRKGRICWILLKVILDLKEMFSRKRMVRLMIQLFCNHLKSLLRIFVLVNINKLIFKYLNVNSLRNKFDILSEQIKGSIDIFMASETKLKLKLKTKTETKLSSLKANFYWKAFIHHLDLIVTEMVEELCFTHGKISRQFVKPWFPFCGKLFYWDQPV